MKVNRGLLRGLVVAAASAVLIVPGAAFAQGHGQGQGGPPSGHGGASLFGNNLSKPLVFADNVGLGDLPAPSDWTVAKSYAGDWTGLRGTPETSPQSPLDMTGLTAPSTDYPGYYLQDTVNYWRAEYAWNPNGEGVSATATWGDNLNQTWLVSHPIRVEVALTASMSSSVNTLFTTADENGAAGPNGFSMTNLTPSTEGEAHIPETWATDGVTSTYTDAYVYTPKVSLTIDGPADSNIHEVLPFTSGEGSGFSAEVNASGGVVYGYNWLTDLHPVPGTYTLTFTITSGNVTLANGTTTTITTKTVEVTGSRGKGGGKGSHGGGGNHGGR